MGNLRTSMKITMTASVDQEKTGTTMLVSAGKKKIKKQSVQNDDSTECKLFFRNGLKFLGTSAVCNDCEKFGFLTIISETDHNRY